MIRKIGRIGSCMIVGQFWQYGARMVLTEKSIERLARDHFCFQERARLLDII
jgi:hypothetical protein